MHIPHVFIYVRIYGIRLPLLSLSLSQSTSITQFALKTQPCVVIHSHRYIHKLFAFCFLNEILTTGNLMRVRASRAALLYVLANV